MKGLLLKDLLNLKSQAGIILLFMSIYIVMSLISQDFSTLITIIPILAGLLPLTTLSYDERAQWEKYALSMPINRMEIVFSKYILGLFFSFIGTMIILLLYIATNMLTVQSFQILVLFSGLSILIFSVILPIIFKLGVEKGRMIVMMFFLAPSMLALVAMKLNLSLPSLQALAFITQYWLLVFIFGVLSTLWISILLSLKFYSKKEL